MTEEKRYIKPPLGLEPRYAWDAQRVANIYAAVDRHMGAVAPIPIEWIEEYNELCRGYKK